MCDTIYKLFSSFNFKVSRTMTHRVLRRPSKSETSCFLKKVVNSHGRLFMIWWQGVFHRTICVLNNDGSIHFPSSPISRCNYVSSLFSMPLWRKIPLFPVTLCVKKRNFVQSCFPFFTIWCEKKIMLAFWRKKGAGGGERK